MNLNEKMGRRRFFRTSIGKGVGLSVGLSLAKSFFDTAEARATKVANDFKTFFKRIKGNTASVEEQGDRLRLTLSHDKHTVFSITAAIDSDEAHEIGDLFEDEGTIPSFRDLHAENVTHYVRRTEDNRDEISFARSSLDSRESKVYIQRDGHELLLIKGSHIDAARALDLEEHYWEDKTFPSIDNKAVFNEDDTLISLVSDDGTFEAVYAHSTGSDYQTILLKRNGQKDCWISGYNVDFYDCLKIVYDYARSDGALPEANNGLFKSNSIANIDLKKSNGAYTYKVNTKDDHHKLFLYKDGKEIFDAGDVNIELAVNAGEHFITTGEAPGPGSALYEAENGFKFLHKTVGQREIYLGHADEKTTAFAQKVFRQQSGKYEFFLSAKIEADLNDLADDAEKYLQDGTKVTLDHPMFSNQKVSYIHAANDDHTVDVRFKTDRKTGVQTVKVKQDGKADLVKTGVFDQADVIRYIKGLVEQGAFYPLESTVEGTGLDKN